MTVTHAATEAGEAPSLAPLIDMLSADMAGVNATIIDRMASEVPLIPQLAGHLIASGGKPSQHGDIAGLDHQFEGAGEQKIPH